MYYYDWIPKPIEIDGQDGKKQTIEPSFEGKVKVRAPKYLERLGYFKDAAITVEDGSFEMSQSNIERVQKMVEIAKKHIESVELKRIEDGYEFNSIDDLEYDIAGGEVLVQVASSVLEGASLGKNLNKESSAK